MKYNIFVWDSVLDALAINTKLRLSVDDFYVEHNGGYLSKEYGNRTETYSTIDKSCWLRVKDSYSYKIIVQFIVNESLDNNNYFLIKGLRLKLLK